MMLPGCDTAMLPHSPEYDRRPSGTLPSGDTDLREQIRNSYEHTIYACYVGYITQAIVNNFVPLLFLTFVREMNLTLGRITLLTTFNFLVQLLVDLAATKVVDRVGYRPCVKAAHLFSAAGLVGLAVLPRVTGNAMAGLLLAVMLYAVGGGLIEVLISPIVEACPTRKKEAAMSLLHSFYCWGHVGVVLLSTLFFRVFGIGNWRIMAVVWAAVPLANFFYFSYVPIYPIVGQEDEKISLRDLLRMKAFWLLIVLMICAGASEQGMSQWASAFAEAGLHVSKTVGDLAGPCLFALLMGTSRALYGKFADVLPLKRMMTGSAVLCICCYLTAVLAKNPVLGLLGCAVCGFSVGIFWPGTFSVAGWSLRGGGTALYALLALAGDVGCSSGPTVVGLVSSAFGDRLQAGLAAAMIFPVIMLLGITRVKEK